MINYDADSTLSFYDLRLSLYVGASSQTCTQLFVRLLSFLLAVWQECWWSSSMLTMLHNSGKPTMMSTGAEPTAQVCAHTLNLNDINPHLNRNTFMYCINMYVMCKKIYVSVFRQVNTLRHRLNSTLSSSLIMLSTIINKLTHKTMPALQEVLIHVHICQ